MEHHLTFLYYYVLHLLSDESEKIGQEELKCKAIADNAQRDLDEAVPALEAAMTALDALNKKDITEIKETADHFVFTISPEFAQQIFASMMNFHCINCAEGFNILYTSAIDR